MSKPNQGKLVVDKWRRKLKANGPCSSSWLSYLTDLDWDLLADLIDGAIDDAIDDYIAGLPHAE